MVFNKYALVGANDPCFQDILNKINQDQIFNTYNSSCFVSDFAKLQKGLYQFMTQARADVGGGKNLDFDVSELVRNSRNKDKWTSELQFSPKQNLTQFETTLPDHRHTNVNRFKVILPYQISAKAKLHLHHRSQRYVNTVTWEFLHTSLSEKYTGSFF